MTTPLRDRAEHASKYGANLVVPAVDIKQLLDGLDAANAATARVHELHTADGDGNCGHCTRGRVYPVPAPCDTAAALAEGGDPR